MVEKRDIKTIDYNSTDEEDLYADEGIVNAANKVFDYNKFKEDGGFAGQSIVNAANKILSEDTAGQSILNQANKVFNFKHFKREQARKIQEYNHELLNETAETINYVDHLSMDDVRESKYLLLTTKKIKDKYRKMRRQQQQKINDAETINYVDDLNLDYVKENKNLLLQPND